MKKNIDNYIGSIVHDNEDAIMNGWYSSIADYIIHNAENGAGWYEYFDDSETEDNLGEPTQEQIDELEAYLEENYNYLPEIICIGIQKTTKEHLLFSLVVIIILLIIKYIFKL